MLIWATKTLPAAVGRALFLTALFAMAAVLQMLGTSLLRGAGFGPGVALLLAGGGVLSFVLAVQGLVQLGKILWQNRLDRLRRAAGLPDGPYCIVWRPKGDQHTDMPWEVEGVVKPIYPKLARQLGVEGLAIIDFEMTTGGKAKNLHPVDCWPAQIFYDAAAEALRRAHFNLKSGEAPRLGKFYRMPFVFRIDGVVSADRVAAPAKPRAGFKVR